jgi:hypothetical protein
MVKKQTELFTAETLKSLETEREFQSRVTELARMLGWSVYSVPDSRRATLSGYPDLTMWRVTDRRLIFAELKREKGRISPAQEVIIGELRALGRAEVVIWKPSDWPEIVGTLQRP